MGVVNNIDYDKFPKQGGYLGLRVNVCFNYNTKKLIPGIIVRHDHEDPWEVIIKLDDGRFIRDAECQFTLE